MTIIIIIAFLCDFIKAKNCLNGVCANEIINMFHRHMRPTMAYRQAILSAKQE